MTRKMLTLSATLLLAAQLFAGDAPDPFRIARGIVVVDGARAAIYPDLTGGEDRVALSDASGKMLRTFTVRDAEPAAVGRGSIYSVARLPEGGIAIAFGWNDPKLRNRAIQGVAFFDRRGTEWVKRSRVLFPANVRDIIAGPGDLILAVTTNGRAWTDKAGSPLLTITDSRGKDYGAYFRIPATADPQLAIRSRLAHVAGRTYALFDAAQNVVHIFEVNTNGEVKLVSDIDVSAFPAELPNAETTYVRAFAASANGAVKIVRTDNRAGVARTFVSTYAGAQPPKHARYDVAINQSFIDEGGKLVGVGVASNGKPPVVSFE